MTSSIFQKMRLWFLVALLPLRVFAADTAPVIPVKDKVIDDLPKVSVVSSVEDVTVTAPDAAASARAGKAFLSTLLNVKMRYRALFDGGGKAQIFDVTVPVYYDEATLLLNAPDRVLLQQYGAELESLLQAYEALNKRAQRLSQGLVELYARGRPLTLLAPGYKPVQAFGVPDATGNDSVQVPLVYVR